MAVDVTDASFEVDVLARSVQVPVLVDLWAPWCGPCRTLGPILEKVVAETEGGVDLVKVNVDENPRVAATFAVQSIPAVFALHDRQIVDSFVGALPESAVREFVGRLSLQSSEADLLAEAGDEASLRAALDLEPDHPTAVVGLAEILVGQGDGDRALALLARLPETTEVRRVAALARIGSRGGVPVDGELDAKLGSLLDRVRDDETARLEFLDLLELLGADDPRTTHYRKAFTSRLY